MAKNDDVRPDAPDPWAILDRLSAALASAQSAPAASANMETMARLTEALQRVSEAQMEGAKLIASENRRVHRPSNEIVPRISPFNRRGELLDKDTPGPHKMPLKCTMLIPWLVEWESVTREEVDLLNLLEPGDYVSQRADRSKIHVEVRIDYDVTGTKPTRLLLNHKTPDGGAGTAFNNDGFKLQPPIPEFLRYILKQHRPEVAALAAAVMSDEEEAALIACGDLAVSR